MFILGYYFPASEGNIIPNDKVVAKVEADVDMSKVASIKLFTGDNKSNHTEEWKTLSSLDSFLAKALVHFFELENESKTKKYMVYTNKYQMSELSKQIDTDAESKEICRMFDGMVPMHLEVTYK